MHDAKMTQLKGSILHQVQILPLLFKAVVPHFRLVPGQRVKKT